MLHIRRTVEPVAIMAILARAQGDRIVEIKFQLRAERHLQPHRARAVQHPQERGPRIEGRRLARRLGRGAQGEHRPLLPRDGAQGADRAQMHVRAAGVMAGPVVGDALRSDVEREHQILQRDAMGLHMGPMGGGDALAAQNAVQIADAQNHAAHPVGQIIGRGIAHGGSPVRVRDGGGHGPGLEARSS
jgi:hypothetical protein